MKSHGCVPASPLPALWFCSCLTRDRPCCESHSCSLCPPLPAQVVDYYKEACRALENSETASLLGKIQKDWKKLVQMKIYYFAAVAHVSGRDEAAHWECHVLWHLGKCLSPPSVVDGGSPQPGLSLETCEVQGATGPLNLSLGQGSATFCCQLTP